MNWTTAPLRPKSKFQPLPAKLNHIIGDFLEICLHNILYHRGLYPSQLFNTKKAYGGCPTHVSRHIELTEYIATLCRQLCHQICLDQTQRIVLAILDPHRTVSTIAQSALHSAYTNTNTNSYTRPEKALHPCLERLVFEINIPAEGAKAFSNTDSSSSGSSNTSGSLPSDLMESFKQCIYTLQMLDTKLMANPTGCEWTVLLYTHHHHLLHSQQQLQQQQQLVPSKESSSTLPQQLQQHEQQAQLLLDEQSWSPVQVLPTTTNINTTNPTNTTTTNMTNRDTVDSKQDQTIHLNALTSLQTTNNPTRNSATSTSTSTSTSSSSSSPFSASLGQLDIHPCRIFPLFHIHQPYLHLQIWAEEVDNKTKTAPSS